MARRMKTMPRKRAATKSAKRAKATLSRNIKNNVLFCKRSAVLGELEVSNVWQWNRYVFTLDALPSFNEFTALFTHYKINAVKLQFVPAFTEIDGAGVLNRTQPRVYTMVDRTGISSITTENSLLQYSNKRHITKAFEPFSIYIKAPAVEASVETVSLFSQGMPQSGRWIATDTPDVLHKGAGIGTIMPFMATGNQWVYQVVATYYLAFKGAR